MDFFEFLNKSKSAKSNTDNKTLTPNKSLQAKAPYAYFKKGDRIRIIYKTGSFLNSYKGYIGEVHQCKNDNTALVILHAMNCLKPISFPQDHFIKMVD
jgi:ribosomal protein L21E